MVCDGSYHPNMDDNRRSEEWVDAHGYPLIQHHKWTMYRTNRPIYNIITFGIIVSDLSLT